MTEAVTSWQAAERVAAVWVRWLGHRDARITAGGTDGGIDVVSATALGQVKFYSSAPIGRPDVQRLYGTDEGAGRDLFFFSTSGFTRQAIECADRVGVACFKLTAMGGLAPENNKARVVLGRAAAARAGQTWVDPVEQESSQALWVARGIDVLVYGAMAALTISAMAQNPDSEPWAQVVVGWVVAALIRRWLLGDFNSRWDLILR